MAGYLVIRNWERYQHYKDRKPIWVKFYTDLLDDYELSALPNATRLLYDQFLLLAGRTDNLIPNDPRWIAGKTHIDETNVARSIDELVAIGFVRPVTRKPPASTERASNPPAERYPSRAPAPSLEVEAEREEEHAPIERGSSSNGTAETTPPPPAKKAATAKGQNTNLTQNRTVADRILEPYRQAARWMKHDGWRYDDWRFRIETEYGISDDVELAALENIREQAAAEAGLR